MGRQQKRMNPVPKIYQAIPLAILSDIKIHLYAYLVLLSFALLCFAGIVRVCSQIEDPQPAKGLELAEGSDDD